MPINLFYKSEGYINLYIILPKGAFFRRFNMSPTAFHFKAEYLAIDYRFSAVSARGFSKLTVETL